MEVSQPTTRIGLLTLFCFAVFLLSTYDIYFPLLGIPIVPVLGTVLLLAATMLSPRPRFSEHLRTHYRTIFAGILLILFCLISSLWGVVRYGSVNPKAFLGLALGTVMFLLILLREESPVYRNYLYRGLNVALGIHVTFWLIQFAYFWLYFGTYLDFIYPITGVPQRHLHELASIEITVVRFTGLFAEPAIYSTFLFMGISARLVHNNYQLKRFDWLMMTTVLFCLSLSGYALMFILVMIYAIKTGRIAKILKIVLPILALLGLALAILQNSDVGRFILLRMSAPLADPSGNARITSPFNYFQSLSEEEQFFGLGLGNYDNAEEQGNSVIFMLEYTGYAGFLAITGAFVWMLRQRRVPAVIWVMLCAPLFGPELFTIEFWWYWVALLVLSGQTPEPEPALIPAAETLPSPSV